MLTGVPRGKEGGISELWRLTYPLMLSTASVAVMQFVNRLFLSRFSPEAIAAAVPAGTLSFTVISFFVGMTAYTNVFIAQYYGGRRYARLSVALWQGVWLAVFTAAVIIATVPLGRWIISTSAHAPEVKILEVDYYTIVAGFGGLATLNAALSSFFTGQGKTKITMWVNVAGNVINVIFSYLLVFGFGGVAPMGIRGAAYALVIGSAAMAGIYSFFIFSQHNRRVFRTGRLFGFYWPQFKQLLKYGVPNGASFFMEIASFTVFIFLVGNTDKYILAANNIGLTIDMLAFLPIVGVGMAAQTLVGQYIGRKKKEVAFKVVRSALALVLPYTIALSLIFLFAPQLLLGLFVRGTAEMDLVAAHAYPLMKVLSVFIFFDALNVVYSDAIKGAGDTRFQLLMASVWAWLLFVPGVYVILSVLRLSFIYTWVWGCFYAALLALTFFLRFKSGVWQRINITA